jgi:serine/threonine protein kinase
MPKTRTSAHTNTTVQSDSARYELLNYRLHECIGQEELTVVYAATHLTLDRPVQVHILRRPDRVSVSRFQLAGRLLARLNHPNLLPVIDAGHDDRLGDYIVTPMLDAQRLSDVLAQHTLTVPQTLRIATQVAAALDYLHTEQIIHRDVQPDNILVTAQGMAYLKNLSLATGPDVPDLGNVEEADYLTAYSAPEQHLDHGEASPALDVYGLGAVLFHMFSGEVPAPPGHERPDLARHDPTLKEVDQVLQRMLASEPDARFASAGEAIGALRHALRTHIDVASDDMEVSRWQPVAQWLENPLETLLLQVLEEAPDEQPHEAAAHDAEATAQLQESISKSRARADSLHRGDTIRRLLNRWSRKGFFRRADLGKIIELDQVVSYNIYFYDLRTLYETRLPPQPRQRPMREDDRTSPLPMPSLWDVVVPEAPPFTPVKPQELVLPNSIHVMECYDCNGAGKVVCTKCSGDGFVKKSRKVRNADDSVSTETVSETCPICHGYGKVQCERCEGKGKLAEEDVFTWSRSARLWQNTDDLEDLPRLAIKQRTEPVCSAMINPYDGHWHSVAPLAELLHAAIDDADSHTRLKAAELSIHSVPITEVDYQINEKPHRLYILGHDNHIVGNWTLLNFERVVLAVIGVALLIGAIVWGVLMLI